MRRVLSSKKLRNLTASATADESEETVGTLEVLLAKNPQGLVREQFHVVAQYILCHIYEAHTKGEPFGIITPSHIMLRPLSVPNPKSPVGYLVSSIGELY